ncbi:MAG: tRNA (N6-isopentenyl adenosine(37)-C2)-methylthiotransferase MiaB [Deltaproteobacteria bacterium]|nr:tRNA (N6-isopentenyl adenosine(37)-C2)-methylthiotransferase MiaB [Deltaproteobacteria bacterium]
MKNKYLHIITIGCQMNIYDSEQMAIRLKALGYILIPFSERADLIIVNTCAIREKAEQKVFSLLGRMAKLKKKKPGLILGVGGCVAQQEGKKLLQRVPCLDLVFGTHTAGRLPELIERIEQQGCRIVDIGMSDQKNFIESVLQYDQNINISKFVTIMQGCENFCTYCVVPYVRGKEISRKPEAIIKEIKILVTSGAREITLLGQNVNSYGKKEGIRTFPELLASINRIEGLKRIRFTTSHPKDLSDELIECFANLDKLCKHIHLPVQSGSNRILRRMNRKYTREEYLEKIEKLRKICPDIAVSTDLITGFPGESKSDFEDTLELMKQVEYDSIFAFKYSDRPNAKAAGFSDKISENEKRKRLQRILKLQEGFTAQKNSSLAGLIQPVLVEGLSKKQYMDNQYDSNNNLQWTGRTSTNKIVNFFHGNDRKISDGSISDQIYEGKLVDVKIEKALLHSLKGKLVIPEPRLSDKKGDNSYVA